MAERVARETVVLRAVVACTHQIGCVLLVAYISIAAITGAHALSLYKAGEEERERRKKGTKEGAPHSTHKSPHTHASCTYRDEDDSERDGDE